MFLLSYQGALLQYFNVCKVTLVFYYTVVCMWGCVTVLHLLKYHSHVKNNLKINTISLLKKNK